MKILIIHNFHTSNIPSGEDVVVENEEKLLLDNSHEVKIFSRHNDNFKKYSIIKKLSHVYSLTWSRKSADDLGHLIRDYKPDIAHIHNTYPLITPSVYYTCKKMNLPIVQTIHNYRLWCSAAILYRNNSICELCFPDKQLNSLIHACHKDSFLYSAPHTLLAYTHSKLKTWSSTVDITFALTPFVARKLEESGFNPEKIIVKPNFIWDTEEPEFTNDGSAVFVGRLANEKGAHILIDAWRNIDNRTLHIIGEGPDKSILENRVRSENIKNIIFHGMLPHRKVIEYIKKSFVHITPSLWYETFGLGIAEAFSCGTPAIASRHGAMENLIIDRGNGLLFTPGDANDLYNSVKYLIDNPDKQQMMSIYARKTYEKHYTQQQSYQALMKAYMKVAR